MKFDLNKPIVLNRPIHDDFIVDKIRLSNTTTKYKWRKNMYNKKGAVTGGTILIIVLLCVGAYVLIPSVQTAVDDIFGGEPYVPTPTAATTKCPSTGLTEVTLNTQEALASSVTNANTTYFVYDNGALVKNGETGSDGTVAFDVECGVGKKYTMFVNNDKVATGFYGQTVTIDASAATEVINLKMYEYGGVNLASVVSSAAPDGNGSIKIGAGKTCGFTVTFSENETASAFNKPILLLEVNATAITDITMTGVDEVANKIPIRLSSAMVSGRTMYGFEYPHLIKSTDAAVKVSGQLVLDPTRTVVVALTNNLTAKVVDQAKYIKANYQTLSLNEGFLESTENKDTLTEIGGTDSNEQTLYFNGDYC